MFDLLKRYLTRPKLFSIRETVSERDYLRPQRWSWQLLTKPLDARTPPETPLKESARRRGMRFFLLDGVYSTMSEILYASFLVVLLIAFGATNGQIGILTAVTNFFGALALFPGALASGGGHTRRKIIVLTTGGGFGRIALLAVALIPFARLPVGALIALTIGLNALRAFMGNFANPAWTALVADLVPKPIRGRYFSRRNLWMGAATLACLPIAGYVIRRLNGVGGYPYIGFQIVFIAAFLFGVMGTVSFARIPEPAQAVERREKMRFADLARLLGNTPGYATLLLSTLIWQISIQVGGPFFDVFLVRELGGTATLVGVSVAVSTAASLAGQIVFGPMADRRGSIFVQRLTGLLIPILPALWLIISRPLHVLPISALGGFLWAGYNLSNFNLLLELTPDAERPKAVALYQFVVFSAAVAGPLIGGLLIDAVGYHLVFGTSAVGRLAGIVIFIAMIRKVAMRK